MHKTSDWVPPLHTGGILPDEPPHGLYLRLSHINGIPSADWFWTSTSVRLSRTRFGNDLDKLSRISRVDLSELKEASYIRHKADKILIRGNHLKMQEQILLKTRRLCPRCIEVSEHHRFYWDLAVVTTCTEHGIKLVSKCGCGDGLSWQDGQITKCFRCDDGSIETVECEIADPTVIAFDRWVLGRFGLGDPPSEPEILKNLHLSSAIEIVERVAALDLGGYAENWVEIRDVAMPQDLARAHGFRVIAEGRIGEALDRAFEGYLAAHPGEQPGMGTAFGWFHGWFRQQGAERFCAPLARIMLENAAPKFQIVRGLYEGIGWEVTTLTISEARAMCGVSGRTMRKILEHEGKIRAEKRKGSPIMLDRADVERIARDLKDSASLADVKRMLGVNIEIVRALVRSDLLPVWVPGGSLGAKHRFLLRRSEIVEWVDRLSEGAPHASVAEPGWISLAAAPNGKNVKAETLYRALLDGKIKAQAVLGGAAGVAAIQLAISDVVPLATQRRDADSDKAKRIKSKMQQEAVPTKAELKRVEAKLYKKRLVRVLKEADAAAAATFDQHRDQGLLRGACGSACVVVRNPSYLFRKTLQDLNRIAGPGLWYISGFTRNIGTQVIDFRKDACEAALAVLKREFPEEALQVRAWLD